VDAPIGAPSSSTVFILKTMFKNFYAANAKGWCGGGGVSGFGSHWKHTRFDQRLDFVVSSMRAYETSVTSSSIQWRGAAVLSETG
jgi:hypothetical protein